MLIDQASTRFAGSHSQPEHDDGPEDRADRRGGAKAAFGKDEGQDHERQHDSACPYESLGGLCVRFDVALGHDFLDAFLLGFPSVHGDEPGPCQSGLRQDDDDPDTPVKPPSPPGKKHPAGEQGHQDGKSHRHVHDFRMKQELVHSSDLRLRVCPLARAAPSFRCSTASKCLIWAGNSTLEGLRLKDSDFTSEGKLLAGALLAFLFVAVLAAIDIVDDVREGTTGSHVLSESGVLLAGLIGSALMMHRLVLAMRRARAVEREAVDLKQRLALTEADALRWRAEARDLVRGLAVALDQQFDRWALSPAEKETALLLLKGLSHKEIAEVRSVSDTTARQQARAIYKKAGLGGRHDLAAFFLEDLMLPLEADDNPGQATI